MSRRLDLHELGWKAILVLAVLFFSPGGNLHAQSIQPAHSTQTLTGPASVTHLTKRQQRRLIRHDEAGAIRTLFTLLSAEATYQATAGNGDYGTIEELGKQGLVDFVLAEGHRFGYLFRVKPEKFSSESPASFEIFAVPRAYRRTGRRSFYLDQTGVIRYADKKGAEANREDEMIVIDP
jgi:hypothetical protein